MTNPSNPSVDGAESAGGALQRLARAIRDSEFIRSGAVVDGHTITLREYAALAEAAKEALAALSSPRNPQEGESLAFIAHRAFVSGYRCAQEDANRSHPGGEEAHWQEHQRAHPSLAALSPRDAPGEAQDTRTDLGAANTLQGAQGGPASSAPAHHRGSEPVGSSALVPPNSGANEDREGAAGAVTWHSSGEDEGPDVGLDLSLGGGRSLYVGELADATLKDAGIDTKEHKAAWWVAITSDVEGIEVVGPVAETDAARNMIDRLAAAVRAGGRP